MEEVRVLHMNGGAGDFSYANNSLIQRKIISLTRPIIEEAVTNLYQATSPSSLTIADLGCSSGPNTLLVVCEFIKVVETIRRQLDKNRSIEYQIFLNDLHENDFNTIFKSLPSFLDGLSVEIGAGQIGSCFFAGAPGSFYGRLFPKNTVHFIHSSSSLHWLSRVPEGLEENKENVYLSNTSTKSVVEAYYKQFQRDFSLFLKCRAEELVDGGRMVITFLGRNCQDPTSKDCCFIWEPLATALNDMVREGKIEKEKMDNFNLPMYMASSTEIQTEVVKEGRFIINRIAVSVVDLNAFKNEPIDSFDAIRDHGIGEYNVHMVKWIRAVVEPMILTHFGESIIDELFFRCKDIIVDVLMAMVKAEYVNITISLTKFG